MNREAVEPTADPDVARLLSRLAELPATERASVARALDALLGRRGD